MFCTRVKKLKTSNNNFNLEGCEEFCYLEDFNYIQTFFQIILSVRKIWLQSPPPACRIETFLFSPRGSLVKCKIVVVHSMRGCEFVTSLCTRGAHLQGSLYIWYLLAVRPARLDLIHRFCHLVILSVTIGSASATSPSSSCQRGL